MGPHISLWRKPPRRLQVAANIATRSLRSCPKVSEVSKRFKAFMLCAEEGRGAFSYRDNPSSVLLYLRRPGDCALITVLFRPAFRETVVGKSLRPRSLT